MVFSGVGPAPMVAQAMNANAVLDTLSLCMTILLGSTYGLCASLMLACPPASVSS